MRCWRGGSSTWSFVSRHQDTSTVPHQGFILEPARAFTRERQKLGAGGVAALVERTLEGGDWCLEDLSFYSFCSDPPFWAATNPSFGSHGWEEGKARRQLVEKKGFRKGKKGADEEEQGEIKTNWAQMQRRQVLQGAGGHIIDDTCLLAGGQTPQSTKPTTLSFKTRFPAP